MELWNPPPRSIEASPTFTGTVTMPDGATWASSGLANAASYTTSSTSIVNLASTWNYSSTASAIAAMQISPVMVPTGATSGNVSAVLMSPSLGTSAVNVALWRALTVTGAVNAGYSGTVTAANAIQASFINSGTNPVATTSVITLFGTANGNGIVTGTVSNSGLTASGATAAGGVGGTVANNAILINLPTGSSASTTNRGLYIAGNGGGASTNYALYSDSTAASLLSGALSITVDRPLVLTNQTSSAGAQLGTLTNAPTAGNPGFWAKISIGGVSYSFPCWAG